MHSCARGMAATAGDGMGRLQPRSTLGRGHSVRRRVVKLMRLHDAAGNPAAPGGPVSPPPLREDIAQATAWLHKQWAKGHGAAAHAW
jgi:hypothetical protein